MTRAFLRARTPPPRHRAGTGWRAPRRGPMCVRGKHRSSPRASETLLRRRLRLGVDLAEAVLQEHLQRYVLLTDEPALRQLSAREQVEHGANRSGGRNLDGAQGAAVHVAAVDLVGVGLLDQLTLVAAADGDEND